MKKLSYTILALLSLLVASCSEDFDTAAPYKTVTFIYGILDIADTAHYIRIEKAFLDQNKSALDLAKIPDSSYIPNLDVKVKVLNSTGGLVNIITPQKVDVNLEGYLKSGNGQYFTTPNYAYKFKDALNSQYTYRVVVFNPNTGETDSTESPVISNDLNNDFVVPYFLNTSSTIDIAKTSLSDNFNRVAGKAPVNSMVFEGVVRFHWKDRDDASGNETDQYGDWNFANTVLAAPVAPGNSANFQLIISNIQFYSGLRNTMGSAAVGHSRILGACDIFVWTGSVEMYNYSVVTSTQANSLTSDEVKPSYTNVRGKNALGLFACRTMVQDLNIPFTTASIDSLRSNPITLPCNILAP